MGNSLQGAGLGLRRTMLFQDAKGLPPEIDFIEMAPENWIGVGGRLGHQLRKINEQMPIIAHGLSLSIGGQSPLNFELLHSIKHFLCDYDVQLYSEHLSFSDDGGYLYDLLPLPFTDEVIRHTASRIRQVQDILEQKLALENVSYYLSPDPQMSEVDFINAILDESGCELLLDVNNVFVNSRNHDYDPYDFIHQLPASRIRYLHIAGHFRENDGLLIDTHGADVIDPVWDLLSFTYQQKGIRPTLLERDFNIPAGSALSRELDIIKRLQQAPTPVQIDRQQSSNSAQFRNTKAEQKMHSVQHDFCAFLRDPSDTSRPPGLDKRRTDIYSELIFNNIEALLADSFPVVKRLLSLEKSATSKQSSQWGLLIREFLRDFNSATPYFTRLPHEFVAFLHQRHPSNEYPNCLPELAHYEQVEVELFYSQSETIPAAIPPFEEANLALSRLARVVEYQYPVHLVSEDSTTEDCPETLTQLLLYRNADDDVKFALLSAPAYQLLSLIDQFPGHRATYWITALTKDFAETMTSAQLSDIQETGLLLLKELYLGRVLIPSDPELSDKI